MTPLAILEALGRDLAARGHEWRNYVHPLRVLYLHTRDGSTPKWNQWTYDHALKIAEMMGIVDAWPVLPEWSKCPHCQPLEKLTQWESSRLTKHHGNLPDRTGYECSRCHFKWVEMCS